MKHFLRAALLYHFLFSTPVFAQNPDWIPEFLIELIACTEDGKCGQITTDGTFLIEQYCNPAGPLFDPECFHNINGDPVGIYDCDGNGKVDPEFEEIDCIIHSQLRGTLLFEWLDKKCNVKRVKEVVDKDTWIRTKGDSEVDINNLPEDWNYSVLIDLKDVSGTHGSMNDCPRCPKNERLKSISAAISLGLGEN